MKNIIISLIVLLTTACASIEPKPMTGPSGKQAYSMACSGMGRSLDMCYQKASELCSNGYNIVSSENTPIAVTNAINGQVIMGARQSLFIECK